LGITDPVRQRKDVYGHDSLAPKIVILDPEATAFTPSVLWSFLAMKILSDYGAIANTFSALEIVAAPGRSAYMASKFGVIGLTMAAALEYAKSGISINAICQVGICTPMMEKAINSNPGLEADRMSVRPNGCLGTMDEIENTVIWLCSNSASFITGATISVDCGYTAQ
jgi:NAD(P)-dependent dehydrogenase (short-subunit alcohol dehydrogenase family)